MTEPTKINKNNYDILNKNNDNKDKNNTIIHGIIDRNEISNDSNTMINDSSKKLISQIPIIRIDNDSSEEENENKKIN